jgi:hypothetical protein
MGYVSATELAIVLPAIVGTITGSSVPLTIGEVATVVEQIAAELDSAAAGHYSVPIPSTATSAFEQMQLLNIRGAAWMTLRTIFPRDSEGQSALADDYRDAYMMPLKALRDGDLVLIGATDTSTGRELPRSYSTSNPLATSGVVPLIGMDFEP